MFPRLRAALLGIRIGLHPDRETLHTQLRICSSLNDSVTKLMERARQEGNPVLELRMQELSQERLRVVRRYMFSMTLFRENAAILRGVVYDLEDELKRFERWKQKTK
jgi:hypothetical protein